MRPSDLHGALRLAAEATASVADIVEAMHAGMAFPSVFTSPEPTTGSKGLPAFPYAAVRAVAKLTGRAVDATMPQLASLLGETASTPQRDAVVSVLNGIVGDHLFDTGNPLAIAMQLRRDGEPLVLRRDALAADFPEATSRVAVLVHGLCGTDAQWQGGNVNYASRLAAEHGITPVLAHYNSGRHVSESGQDLSAALDGLVRAWPVPVTDLTIVGHSMGGLVARSAVHAAQSGGHAWVGPLRRLAFLGTPHHGAPLERGGHGFEQLLAATPFAAPLARLGRLRSAGITDLRHGNVTSDDWHDRDRFGHAADPRTPLPLPAGVDCLAVAATSGARRGDVRDRLVGDGLVPVASALGHHEDPRRDLGLPDDRRMVIARAGHMALLGHAEVWDRLSAWLGQGTPGTQR